MVGSAATRGRTAEEYEIASLRALGARRQYDRFTNGNRHRCCYRGLALPADRYGLHVQEVCLKEKRGRCGRVELPALEGEEYMGWGGMGGCYFRSTTMGFTLACASSPTIALFELATPSFRDMAFFRLASAAVSTLVTISTMAWRSGLSGWGLGLPRACSVGGKFVCLSPPKRGTGRHETG